MKNEQLYRIICDDMELDFETAMFMIDKRTRKYKDSRQVYFYIKKITTNETLMEIASFFDKHHASVLHGIKTISGLLEYDKYFQKVVDSIIETLKYHKIERKKNEQVITISMTKPVYDSIPKEISRKFFLQYQS